MPLRAMTATSVVPPPMSTTIEPQASVDRHAGADRGGHRFLDQVDLAGAGFFGRFLDRAALDLGRAAGHADQHARARAQEARLVHLADEVLEHFLGVGEVGDDAVLHRADAW